MCGLVLCKKLATNREYIFAINIAMPHTNQMYNVQTCDSPQVNSTLVILCLCKVYSYVCGLLFLHVCIRQAISSFRDVKPSYAEVYNRVLVEIVQIYNTSQYMYIYVYSLFCKKCTVFYWIFCVPESEIYS